MAAERFHTQACVHVMADELPMHAQLVIVSTMPGAPDFYCGMCAMCFGITLASVFHRTGHVGVHWFEVEQGPVFEAIHRFATKPIEVST